jgi:aquaporin Z
MIKDLNTGGVHADLTLNYEHHKKGGLKIKDFQVVLAEFLGTFFLGLIVSCSKVNSDSNITPFAITLGLICLIYTFAPYSGSQFNPAVTLGLVMRNKLNIFEGVYCVAFQIFGAIFASWISLLIYDGVYDDIAYPVIADPSRRGQALVAETLQTFLLVSVILNVATTKSQSNNSYFGIAIAFVILSGSITLGGVTGACFNPAIAMLTLIQGKYDDLWVYLLAGIIGGGSAGLLFRVLNPGEVISSDPILQLMTKAHFNPTGNSARQIAMLLQEFIGTFFLAWIVAISVNCELMMGYLAIGAVVVSLAYSGSTVSGGHYNPSITIGIYLRGLLEQPQLMRGLDVIPYMIVQCLGSICGAFIASYTIGNGWNDIKSPYHNNNEKHTDFAAICCEMMFTFLLLMAVFSCGTQESVAGNSYFAMAVGFAIIAGMITFGSVCGGVFNPAIDAIFPLLTDKHTDSILIYLVGSFSGSLLAAVVFSFLSYDPLKNRLSKGNDDMVIFDSMRESLMDSKY